MWKFLVLKGDVAYFYHSLCTKEPVPHNSLAFFRQHALGVELDAVDVIVFVFQAHDATVVAHGGYVEALGEIASVYHP